MYVIGGFALYYALKGTIKGLFSGKKKIKDLKERKKIEKEIADIKDRLESVEHQLAEGYEQQREKLEKHK